MGIQLIVDNNPFLKTYKITQRKASYIFGNYFYMVRSMSIIIGVSLKHKQFLFHT